MPILTHHPFSQKMVAYNSFIHKLLTVPIDENDSREGSNTIKYIAFAFGCQSSTINRLLRKHKNKKPNNLQIKNSDAQNTFISITFTAVYKSLSEFDRIVWSSANNNVSIAE